jgi:large subunit ribosomal protein L5
MNYVPNLKLKYTKEIVPALKKEFKYKSVMQVPRLEKIILNQGVGDAVADKKLIEVALTELSNISGQKAIQTYAKKDISNFKLRRKMPLLCHESVTLKELTVNWMAVVITIWV